MPQRQYTVVIVGATGVVGRTLLRVMEARGFPAGELRLVATSRSAGTRISAYGRDWTVAASGEEALEGADFVFVSAGGDVSRRWCPAAAGAGAIAIDDSSAFRLEAHVPLVIPEINGDDVAAHRGIISQPNCSTTPLVMALAPLQRAVGVRRVVAVTYQSVSGTGGAAVRELEAQQRARVLGEPLPAAAVYPRRIDENVLPVVDAFQEDGFTKEEHKVAAESRKILHAPHLLVSATCARVPLAVGHSVAAHVELGGALEVAEARRLVAAMPGVTLMDEPAAGIFPTALDVAGGDGVLVGRIRRDPAFDHGIAFWAVVDNLRKGAATNMVQIAEAVIARGLR